MVVKEINKETTNWWAQPEKRRALEKNAASNLDVGPSVEVRGGSGVFCTCPAFGGSRGASIA